LGIANIRGASTITKRLLNPLFIALIFLPGLLFARLGETLDQCKTRYSAVGQLGADQFKFRQGHINIIVHVRNGRSIQEDFAPEGGGSLSESDFAELLQENSEGSSWEASGETATVISYSRKDGRATAQKAKPNASTTNGGNVKLTVTGAELIIKYTSAAISQLAPGE
jgi:hypothetical protein